MSLINAGASVARCKVMFTNAELAGKQATDVVVHVALDSEHTFYYTISTAYFEYEMEGERCE